MIIKRKQLVLENELLNQKLMSARKEVDESHRLLKLLKHISESRHDDGESHLGILVQALADFLEVDIVIIGKTIKNQSDVEVIAGCHSGQVLENFVYSVANTPCENVTTGDLVVIEKGVSGYYPGNDFLTSNGVEGYAGCPILNIRGEVMGVIVIMSRSTLRNVEMAEVIIPLISDGILPELEKLDAEERALTDKKRYRELFNESPIPLWEEDFTDLMKFLDKLRIEGVTDIEDYIDDNPGVIQECISRVKILDFNQAAIDMHKAGGKEHLLKNLDKILFHNSFKAIKEQLAALWSGNFRFVTEGESQTIDGDTILISLELNVRRGHGGSYIGIIATTDITRRKEFEERMIQVAQRASAQRSAIARLAVDKTLNAIDLSSGFRRITRIVAKTLDIENVSLWLFNEDNSALVCHTQYMGGSIKVPARKPIEVALIPGYLEILRNETLVSVCDARNDERVKELTETGLIPEEVCAFLDAPVLLENDLAGVICIESTQGNRCWEPDEESFVVAIAAIVSRALSNSEMLKAEENLRISEEHFRGFFENSLTGKSMTAVDGTLKANIAFCEMLGYSEEELNRLSWKEITHPDDIPASEDIVRSLLSGEADTGRFEKRYIHKSGSLVYADISTTLLKDSKGNPTFFISTINDITRRVKYLERLKREENRLQCFKRIAEYQPKTVQDLLDFALEEAISLTQSSIGYISYYNEEKEEFTLSSWSSQVIEECSIDMPERIYRLEKTGLWGEVVRQRREILINDFADDSNPRRGLPEGHLEIVRFISIPVFDNDEIVAVVGLANKESDYDEGDLLQLKLLMGSVWKIVQKHMVDERNAQLSQAIEQSPATIMITDLDGNLEYVNSKFTALTGYMEEEVIGKNPRILSSGHQSPEFYKDMWDTIKAGKDWEGEFLNKKRSGEFFWEQAHISPVFNAMGELTNYMAVKEDVTERKRVHMELIEAKERAEQSDRLKSAFLTNISHEIRTPMNGIMGFTTLLRDESTTGEERERFLELIERSSHRLLGLINDLIDLSKIESGVMDLKFSNTNINEQLDYLVNFFSPEAESKNIDLRLVQKLPDGNELFSIDRDKVFAVLLNLTKNALKYTPSGSIHISCSKDSEWIVFEVKDTGIGIPPDKIDFIFQRFIQADNSDTRKFEGAGLGLSISKGYIEAMGGNIWVTSKIKEGSSFFFRIPAIEAGDDQPELRETEVLPEVIDGIELKIVIVEDDEASSALLETSLKSIARQILRAETGEAAIELLADNRDTDLILMDLKLPGISGYEAVTEIRKSNKEVVIIAQSAYTQPKESERAIREGCNAYISTPVSTRELLNMIRQQFSRST